MASYYNVTKLLQILIKKEINTSLLLEFYEEAIACEKVFYGLVTDLVDETEIESKRKSLYAVEKFCSILKEVISRHSIKTDEPLYFPTELAKRETMISHATRFLDLLENEFILNKSRS